MPPKKVLSRDDYTVGWVTALPLELAAATAMLNEEHKRPSSFEQPSTDHNTYTWGRVEEHNVVMASLPAGIYGTVSAATVASSLLSSFPHIRVGLLVGIGAGVPRPGYDIRLGDVVVSEPGGRSGGVIQYDLGKAVAGGDFERKGSLNMPPNVLLTALATLKAKHERQPSEMPQILEQMLRNNPFMAEPQDERPGYEHQGVENDRLFDPDYQHVGGFTCEKCDSCREQKRKPRGSSRPRIHHGTIASGNTLIKNGTTRDSIIQRLDEDCICFEMEAAGLMNNFPCLVIRGICDYADSHKNDRWQRCAAATAAAYAKELLSVIPKISVLVACRTITHEAKRAHILEALKFDVIDERYNGVSKEAENTFRWIFEDSSDSETSDSEISDLETSDSEAIDSEISNSSDTKREVSLKSWLTSGARIFHICGKLGSGKSTLMKYIWENDQTIQSLRVWAQEHQQQLVTARFFFWRAGNPRQKTFAGLARSLLAQILRQCPEMIDVLFPSKLDSATRPLPNDRFDITISDDEASDAYNKLIHHEAICSTHCFCFFIDGLDEFEEKDRTYTSLIQLLNDWASGSSVKLCVSSRELDVFESYLAVSWRIKLQDFTRQDIEALVHQTLNNHVHFRRLRDKDSRSCKLLLVDVTEKAEGVFLWVVLALKLLSEGLENRYSVHDLREILGDIPQDLKDLFQRMLASIPESQKRKSFCMLSIAAKLYELDLSPFSLLMASFLSDYFQDPTFAERLGSHEMSDLEVEERLVESKAQWIGRCKGLLEVQRGYSPEAAFGDRLEFTHRSIADYLQEHDSQFEDREVVDPFMQTYLAVIKTAPLRDRIEFCSQHLLETINLLDLLCSYPKTDQLRYFPVLQQIDRAFQQKQVPIYHDIPKKRWRIFTPSPFPDYGTPYLSLRHVACANFSHEYLEWKFKLTPAPHQDDEMERTQYLVSAVNDINVRGSDCTRIKETFRVLFQQGCNPNASLIRGDPEKGTWEVSPWLRLLMRPNWEFQSAAAWTGIEAFLESGAYHPEWIHDSRNEEVTITHNGKHYPIVYFYRLESLPPCLRQPGGRAYLKDWVELFRPENADAILELLKRPGHHPVKRPRNPDEPPPGTEALPRILPRLRDRGAKRPKYNV